MILDRFRLSDKVAIVTGAGRGFCAGADIGGWDQRIKSDARPPSKMLVERGSPEVPVALTRGKPIIAAVNGVAVGVGLHDDDVFDDGRGQDPGHGDAG